MCCLYTVASGFPSGSAGGRPSGFGRGSDFDARLPSRPGPGAGYRGPPVGRGAGFDRF